MIYVISEFQQVRTVNYKQNERCNINYNSEITHKKYIQLFRVNNYINIKNSEYYIRYKNKISTNKTFN